MQGALHNLRNRLEMEIEASGNHVAVVIEALVFNVLIL